MKLKWLLKAVKHAVVTVMNYRRKLMWRKTFQKRVTGEVLTKEQKDQIDGFYAPFVKGKVDYRYHEFYTEKTGIFSPKYIPDEIHYLVLDQFYNDWESAMILDNKCYYRIYLKDVKQPQLVCMRMNGFWYTEEDDDLKPLPMEDVYQRIAVFECFAKQATESDGGHGVVFLPKDCTEEQLREKLNTLVGDIVVQQALKQSSKMGALNESSVNTVRVLSFLQADGTVKVYSSIVRMGINGSKVDNASSGGITCGLDETGRLKKVAYSADGKMYKEHPDTGFHFDNCVVPNYDKIIKIVKKTHLRFSHYRMLSWDFAIDETDEPVFIEVNLCYGELDFHQLNNGPLFGDDTEKVLQECFSKKGRH